MKTLSEELVEGFSSEYSRSGAYAREPIAELTKLAISEDASVAEPATRAFFVSLVERLADSFDPDAVSLYNRTFAQVIQICRLDPRAKSLDRELSAFGLAGEPELIARAERLRQVPRLTAPAAIHVERVIVLSRVTLGADVAISSVILERMKHIYPAAEIVLLGGRKASELFGGDARLRFRDIDYRRGGLMIERLHAWLDVLSCVRELTRDLTPSEYVVVDPDSRLTQLGLLPITETCRAEQRPKHLFFPSREYGSSTSQSLSELTCAWLNEVGDENVTTHPRVSLTRSDLESGCYLANRLRRTDSRPIIAINFGVGENPLKRVGAEFETALVNRLLQEGAALILDKGAGAEETARVDRVVSEATRSASDNRRVRSIETNEHNLAERPQFETDILVWNGRIGMLAALIGESDLYVGYDSAGQHIAAALDVPCIDVFAGYSSPRMLDRWRPTGKAATRLVSVDGKTRAADVVAKVLGHTNELLKNQN